MSYESVRERLNEAAGRVGRVGEDITLVAVSKTFTPDDILEIYEKGHRDFGENRASEMAEKAAVLPEDIRWHFVGALQSNKAKIVRDSTHLLHSMDRRSLAKAWLKGRGHPPPVLVQVNVGEEEQKSGVAPHELADTIDWMTEMGLVVKGLMAIPPIPDTPEDSRGFFEQMRDLRDEIALDHPSVSELSMGMTDDFEVAVEEGASIIRVGRAIFGPRN